MRGAILSESFFVSGYRRNFGGHKINCLYSCCLDIWVFIDEVFGIDPIQKNMFFLTTLDGLASILRSK